MNLVDPDGLQREAWSELQASVVHHRGQPVGTVAARDTAMEALNYDQVFTRDFAVSAFAFLARGEFEIVRNFLRTLIELQAHEPHLDCFRPGEGLMPASFAVRRVGGEEVLVPDFGEYAIARVAPVDAGLWWLIVLRAYVRASGDVAFAQNADCQEAISLVLRLSLTPRFDMYPTMLVPDGSYMIDRRMGVGGYPFDIQALLFAALSAARELLTEGDPLIEQVTERLGHLTYHLREYYWLDFAQLNRIYRFGVEQYGSDGDNRFNIQPESIPDWIVEWLPSLGGYFAGNVGPGHLDFRYFAQGNLLAVITALATPAQASAFTDLLDQRWNDLVGAMPAKLCFPALEGRDWRTVTGADRKNVPWSYHNGGNWPFLLWMFTAAMLEAGRPDLAKRACDQATARLGRHRWPEYYDGRDGRLVGKEARVMQTWSIAGYLVAQEMLAKPELVKWISYDEEPAVAACAVRVGDEMASVDLGS